MKSILLLSALLIAMAAPKDIASGEGFPYLAIIQGEVEYRDEAASAEWRKATAGQHLREGTTVRTRAGSRTEIALGSGAVRLYESSRVHFPGGAMGEFGIKKVELEVGRCLFDVIQRRPPVPFQVHTPQALITVKGTRFSVTLVKDTLSVSVAEGIVELTSETLPNPINIAPGMKVVGNAEQGYELKIE